MTNDSLKNVLRQILNEDLNILNANHISGGDINEVIRINTDKGDFCIKINDAKCYPEMFQMESEGLELLRTNSTFKIPEVITSGNYNDKQYLVIEFIHSASPQPEFWTDFGVKLAKLHQSTDTNFGLDHNNYIGSLTQINQREKSWSEFFGQHRILYQVKLAFNRGLFSKEVLRSAERLCHKLDSIFPLEKPSLLHGDLWSGNFMIDSAGYPTLIDPAVYYGHREMDIAMMHLFGGFNDNLFQAYHEAFPLVIGWEKRLEICNLYPILVHANLFGGHYVNQSTKIIKDWT